MIGDPVAHSLSPAIHLHWLAALAVEGDFRAQEVKREELEAYIRRRRQDVLWRGCSLTSPHKEKVVPLLDRLTPGAASIGAVNCVFREGRLLVGTNTDLDGLAAALAGVRVAGGKAVVIGAGGAARAALAYLTGEQAAEIVLLVRDPDRAEPLSGPGVRAAALEEAASQIPGARLLINASPLGMGGSAPMPSQVLDGLSRSPGAAVLDMVYQPQETQLLAAARGLGLQTISGLAMLVGQAREAFQLFFGAEPPAEAGELRDLLTRNSGSGL